MHCPVHFEYGRSHWGGQTFHCVGAICSFRMRVLRRTTSIVQTPVKMLGVRPADGDDVLALFDRDRPERVEESLISVEIPAAHRAPVYPQRGSISERGLGNV